MNLFIRDILIHLICLYPIGSADRKRCNYVKDDSIDKKFQATNKDYMKSGWSRGHVAACGNYKNSQVWC